MLEMQRKIYSNIIDQQKKILVGNDDEAKPLTANPLLQVNPDYNKLKQCLKRRLESVIEEVSISLLASKIVSYIRLLVSK